MPTFPSAAGLLLGGVLAFTSCQPAAEVPVATDLNSANPAVAEQARKVQGLSTQIARQQAVIETEKTKLTALQQQLDGARQNLDGIKKEVRATP